LFELRSVVHRDHHALADAESLVFPNHDLSRKAFQIRSDVAGIFKRADAPGGSTEAIAFIIAQGAAVVPDSPAPLIPKGLVVQATA